MSNTYYYACSKCEYLVGAVGDDDLECPYCKHSGVTNIYDAEDYRTEDEGGYNYGFPKGHKIKPALYKKLVKEHGYDLKDYMTCQKCDDLLALKTDKICVNCKDD